MSRLSPLVGLGFLAGALVLCRVASAGDVRRPCFEEPLRADGTVPQECFGGSVAAADFDRDGFPELVVGGPTNGSGDGSVSIFSGLDGSLQRRLLGPNCRGSFGRELATGDLDGDGVPDLVVGAPHQGNYQLTNTGGLYIYSGRTGLLIRRTVGWEASMQLGSALGVADLNGDGRQDLIVGASIYKHGGSVGAFLVFSGKTGNLIREIRGAGGRRIGEHLALGDVNQDGTPDLIVSAQSRSIGEVQVFSGKDGELLHRIKGETSEFARSVAATDVDRDGHADLVIGDITAPGKDQLKQGGAVFVYSGRTGSLLREWRGNEASTSFGYSIATGDFDQDGAPEVLVANTGAHNGLGSIQVFSTRTGQETARLDHVADGKPSSGGLGAAMCLVDVNGDKRLDLLTGVPTCVNVPGAALLYFGTDPAAGE